MKICYTHCRRKCWKGITVLEYSQSSLKDEGIIIAKAARVIRRFLFPKEETFNGDLSLEKQKSSVKGPLLQLLSLILNGDTVFDNLSSHAEKTTVNLAQLIRYNAVIKYKRRSVDHVRHSLSNEPPLPVKIGLLIRSKTRKKGIVEAFAAEGLSITYQRVEEIQEAFTNQ